MVRRNPLHSVLNFCTVNYISLLWTLREKEVPVLWQLEGKERRFMVPSLLMFEKRKMKEKERKCVFPGQSLCHFKTLLRWCWFGLCQHKYCSKPSLKDTGQLSIPKPEFGWFPLDRCAGSLVSAGRGSGRAGIPQKHSCWVKALGDTEGGLS